MKQDFILTGLERSVWLMPLPQLFEYGISGLMQVCKRYAHVASYLNTLMLSLLNSAVSPLRIDALPWSWHELSVGQFIGILAISWNRRHFATKHRFSPSPRCRWPVADTLSPVWHRDRWTSSIGNGPASGASRLEMLDYWVTRNRIRRLPARLCSIAAWLPVCLADLDCTWRSATSLQQIDRWTCGTVACNIFRLNNVAIERYRLLFVERRRLCQRINVRLRHTYGVVQNVICPTEVLVNHNKSY